MIIIQNGNNITITITYNKTLITQYVSPKEWSIYIETRREFYSSDHRAALDDGRSRHNGNFQEPKRTGV